MPYSKIKNQYNITDLTIGYVLQKKSIQNRDKVFLHYLPDGRKYTYKDIHKLSNQLANGMISQGLGLNSHVAIMMENCPEMILSIFAIGKIGAVSIPINPSVRGDLLDYYLAQSDSVAIILEAKYIEAILCLSSETLKRIGLYIVVEDGSSVSTHRDVHCSRFINYSDMLKASEENPFVNISFRHTAMIMYTSGTTGPSKGCLFNQVRTFLWGMSHSQALGYRFTDIFYLCMPLFHVSALQGTVFNALMVDASIVLQRKFSASKFWKDVHNSGATIANMMGSMAHILWSRDKSKEDSDHSLRMCQVSPCPDFALDFEQRFKIRFVSGYGLTDYCSSHAFTLSDPVYKIGSAGRTRYGVEARIVDEDDFDVPVNQPGELLLRNNNLWESGEGYYKMPEATIISNRNGWFHTGDIARIDAQGYMWFIGRSKDTIRRRGENISCFEVEKVIKKHPAILDIAAFPIHSKLGEDEVAIAIVLRSEFSLTEIEVIQFCQDKMAPFMIPRYICLVNDLPMTPSFKVKKYELRKKCEDNSILIWDRDKIN
jgi:carnitine-CoA ligase